MTALTFWQKIPLRLFRWLLLPLLLFVAASWLEGPPTRLLVRNPSFVFSCFALSFFAVHFLDQRLLLPRVVIIAQALLVPSGWIYAVQHYYHGGKNQDYALISLFFGLLMMINGILYLLSLFVGHKLHRHSSESLSPRSFSISLYRLDGDKQSTTAVYQYNGREPEQVISLDGFSRTLTIDLDDHWAKMIENQNTDFATPVTTYETIVKFGQTQQLVDHYQLVLHIEYERKIVR